MANSAAIMAHSLSSPGTPLVIEKGGSLKDEGRAKIEYPAKFNYLLAAVISITMLAGVAEIVLAQLWSEPTDLQKNAFSAMDFGWKVGLGAIFGLLTGKGAT